MIRRYQTNAEVVAAGEQYLYGNHNRMPLSIERGEGVYVFDKDNHRYLDFIGGVAVILPYRSVWKSGSGRSSTAPPFSITSPPSSLRS